MTHRISQKTILLVEDQALIALAEKMTLERAGYIVEIAASGELGIEAVRGNPEIDLVLMDIDLGPGMDGTQAAEVMLRERDVALAFLSSHTEPEVVDRTEGITSYGYIVKNSGDTVLLASIRMAFRLHAAHLELKRQKEHLDEALVREERTSEELQEKSDELERYFNASLDMLCIVSTSGEFIRLNPEWERVLGHPLTELQGRPVVDFVHPDDREATVVETRIFSNRDEVHGFENRCQCRDGSYRWIEWRARLVGSSVYAAARDVTDRRRALDAVRESEERFRAVLDGVSSVAVQSYRPDGTTQYWNAASEALYGYTADEAVGCNLLELIIPPEARESVVKSIRRMAATGEAEPPSESMMMRKDGSRVAVYSSHAVVRVPGREQELFCMDIDVSEQKRTEQELLQQRRYLEAILRTSADGFWVIDVGGHLLEANDSYTRMTGYSHAELTTMTIGDIDVQEGPADTRERIARILRNGEEVFEAKHRRKDGTVLDVEISASFLPDSGGHLVCFCRDITERKRAERQSREADEALHAERARLAGIIAGTNVGTWEWNVQTGETVFNERWASIIGYTLDELAPVSIQTWERFTHPDDLRASEASLREHFEGEAEFYDIECRMRHSDGRWVWVHDRGKIISRTADGEPLVMMGTHQEITQRKQTEARIHQLVDEKETLLREVQHRVKNTLNTMVSLISLQAAGLRDQEAVEALNDAAARFRSMEVLYDQLYRTETHNVASVKEYLERLVLSIVDLFPKGREVEIDADVEDVAFDTRRMSTLGIIVNELVTNAMKYALGDSGRNGGRLAVSLERIAGRVTLVVADDGPGLPERFDADTAPGFGMTMVRALAHQLGGSVRFERASGTRAVVEFEE